MDITHKRADRRALFEGSLLDLLPDPVRLCGPAIRGRIYWFSGDAALTRVSCINWSKREFICAPNSNLLDPFMPRHHQRIIIADIELLSIIISIVVWGIPGGGIVHIAVTDNMNDLSLMNRRRAKSGISLKLLETCAA